MISLEAWTTVRYLHSCGDFEAHGGEAGILSVALRCMSGVTRLLWVSSTALTGVAPRAWPPRAAQQVDVRRNPAAW